MTHIKLYTGTDFEAMRNWESLKLEGKIEAKAEILIVAITEQWPSNIIERYKNDLIALGVSEGDVSDITKNAEVERDKIVRN